MATTAPRELPEAALGMGRHVTATFGAGHRQQVNKVIGERGRTFALHSPPIPQHGIAFAPSAGMPLVIERRAA